MKVKITNWTAVSAWRWKIPEEDMCSVCRNQFDGTCSKCRFPGDDCPVAMGKCGHAFHVHCIWAWMYEGLSRQSCPMCRQDWVPRDDGIQVGPPASLRPRRPGATPVQTVVIDD